MVPVVSLRLITVPEIASVMGVYNVIQLESCPTARDGTYALLTTITLVADQHAYAYTDTAATSTTWYRYRYYHTGTTAASDYFEPEPAALQPTVTLRNVIYEAADRLSMYARPPREHTFPGPSGVATSNSADASSVVSAYWKGQILSTSGDDFNSQKVRGWWLRFVTGTGVAAQTRHCLGLDTTTGKFTVDVPFSATPPSGATFELFREHMSPEVWESCAREALKHLYVEVEYAISGVTGRRDYYLPYYFEQPEFIVSVHAQTGTDIYNHSYPLRTGYSVRRDPSGQSLILSIALGVDQVAFVRGYRRNYSPITIDEVLPLATDVFEQLVIGVQLTAARRLFLQGGDLRLDTKQWEMRFGHLERQWRATIKQTSAFRAVTNPHEERVGGTWIR